MALSSGKYREVFMVFTFETRQLECKMELGAAGQQSLKH
jgi:hypothetical protein